MKLPTSILIGDETISEASGGVFEHIFPGTGLVNATITMAGAEEVDRAVKSAAKAQREWMAMTVEQRRDLMFALADALEASLDELAQLNVHDYAVPISFAGSSSLTVRFIGMAVAPALAAGNAVVIKPPELAPMAPIRFGEICREVGLPVGLINIIPGGPAAGDALVRHPWINAYSDIQPSGPYGGYEQSGYGRLGGIEGLDEFCQVKNTRITFNAR
jgi:aldehyde dehydrogenase (NAD+)